MTIEKLIEFAKNGNKNTDKLNLDTGFPVNLKPARQWFNWLFSDLTLKVNEVIDGKLDRAANAVSASKLETVRTISFSGAVTGAFNFDGSANASCVLSGGDLDVLLYSPIPYPSTVAPNGFLVMMGQSISQWTYPKLFALYGSVLPDMRAQSVRGLDNGRGIDYGRTILSEQGDAIRNISGTVGSFRNDGGSGSDGALSFTQGVTVSGGAGSQRAAASISFNAANQVPTASENRVKNIAFLYIVKAG